MLYGDKDEKKALEDFSPSDISNEIEQYVSDVKKAKTNDKRDMIELPKGLQKIKNRIYHIKSIEDKLPDNLDMLFARYGLDVNALLYLKEQHSKYKDLSFEAFLALLGRQITTGDKVSDKELEIMRKLQNVENKENDGWENLYKNEIKKAVSSLAKKEQRGDNDFVRQIKKQYAEATEKSKLYSGSLRDINEKIAEPIQENDSKVVKELKQAYNNAQISKEIREILSKPTDEIAEILSRPIQEDDSEEIKKLKTQYLYTKHGIENWKERNSIFNKSPKAFKELLSSEINPEEDSIYLKELKFRYAVDRAGVEKEFGQMRRHETKAIFNRPIEELEKLLSEQENESDSHVLKRFKTLYKHDRESVYTIAQALQKEMNEELEERKERGR